MSPRHLFVAAVALLVAAPAMPARAAAARTLATVRVAEGYYPLSGTSGSYTYASEPCAVTVAKDGKVSAHDALAAATAARCVSSYKVVRTPPSGSYLVCVEGRCESLGFYWAIYRNGELTCEGIDDILVRSKDEITFSYEPYPTALALAAC
jgi:hypothetical protein